jgi:mycothiol system anti-sigma-R factor
MAECDETIRQLYAYLDDFLDETMKADISSHLVVCPDCQGRMEFEYSLKIHLRLRAQEEPLPEELRQRLLSCFDLDVAESPDTDQS